jgi:hypothetical protein
MIKGAPEQMTHKRRVFLRQLMSVLTMAPLAAFAESAGPMVKVYKSRTCGCCSKWVEHMRAAGFKVEAIDVPDVSPYKIKYGVTPELASCHTALVDGYVVEGHVPADDVIRMLQLRPRIVGIAVPGMPLGSPGMEAPNPERYETLAFDAAGEATVFAVHEP